jgi:acetolactate synthase I/II/III large subunit
MSMYWVIDASGTSVSAREGPAGDARSYGAAVSNLESTEGFVETGEAASARGGLHLPMVTPIDFSENVRVLADELRDRRSEPAKA